MDGKTLSAAIEQSVLRPTATRAEVLEACREAARYGFHGVCINPIHTAAVREAVDSPELSQAGSIKVITVIAFPLGSPAPSVKLYEAMRAADDGSDELDIVIALPRAAEGDWEGVKKDLSDIVAATPGLVHKAIIEMAYLDRMQTAMAVEAALGAGVDFIKTSTGYSSRGATVEDIALLKGLVNGRAGIKASGGIRTAKSAMELLAAGASRLGTSSGVQIVEGKR
ncbi:MAG: deoxyribose-phosphate aldolase [Nitrospiraceae bacterium]|nr:deoxyribose-phosphate aldolase [Nitrospiraceae bacterium]